MGPSDSISTITYGIFFKQIKGLEAGAEAVGDDASFTSQWLASVLFTCDGKFFQGAGCCRHVTVQNVAFWGARGGRERTRLSSRTLHDVLPISSRASGSHPFFSLVTASFSRARAAAAMSRFKSLPLEGLGGFGAGAFLLAA